MAGPPNVSHRFVLDCSVALAWYFEDEADKYADAVAEAMTDSIAVVPSLFHLELANILITGERRKRSTAAQATSFLTRIANLSIAVDPQTVARAWSDTIDLARKHELSSYDAAYLELALRESLPIATLDNNLKSAAKALKVRLFKPS